MGIVFWVFIILGIIALGIRLCKNNRINQLRTKSRLKYLLQNRNFKQADIENRLILLYLADRQQQGYLRDEDIEKISCKDWQKLDSLWLQYSNGRFGYSVQKSIWDSCGLYLKSEYTVTPQGTIIKNIGFPAEVRWIVKMDDPEEYYSALNARFNKQFDDLVFSLSTVNWSDLLTEKAIKRIKNSSASLPVSLRTAPPGHLPTHIRSAGSGTVRVANFYEVGDFPDKPPYDENAYTIALFNKINCCF